MLSFLQARKSALLASICPAICCALPQQTPSPLSPAVETRAATDSPAPGAPNPPSETPAEAPAAEWTPIPAGNPTKTEVSFPTGPGWQGTLVLDNGAVGVWTVAVLKVFKAYACPEIIGLDDKGRCHVLWSYSGKWTPVTTVSDGTWLGGLAQGDVDPRIPGPELYVGSQSGNIYEIVGYPDRIVDNRRVASLGGHEIHTLLAGDLDLFADGPELIAFTLPGGVFELKPKPADQDGFDSKLLRDIDGRVRQAAVLPAQPGQPPEIAVIMRTGDLEILTFTAEGPAFELVHQLGMGMGRLAIKLDEPLDRTVIYSTADDGRVFRHARGADRKWSTELIYAGPQGMRGCVWGHFDQDSSVETIAVFGYCHRVELLSRKEGRWSREILFVDRDKGHWLAAGELDGRNTTDEIVCSGYSGRVVLLSRQPGYGLGGVLAADPVGATH